MLQKNKPILYDSLVNYRNEFFQVKQENKMSFLKSFFKKNNTLSEKKLLEIHPDYDGESLTISPNAQRAAYIAKQRSGSRIILDGRESALYDNLGKPIFSPDSQRLAYNGVSGNTEFWALEGETVYSYREGVSGVFMFSPNSQNTAFGILKRNRWVIVIDGNEHKEVDSIVGDAFFSPDSQIFVFAGKIDGSFVVFWGDEAGKPYDGVGDRIISPDSQKIAYPAQRNNKWCMVENGVEGKPYEGIGNHCTFSPDSQRLAFPVFLGDQYTMIVDGQEGEKFDQLGPPVFSPDSKHLVYAAKAGGKYFVVFDGKKKKAYESVSSPVFSPDSRKLAYVVSQGTKQFVVFEGQEGQPFDSISPPQFSPDSKTLVYGAKSSNHRFKVIDGKPQKAYLKLGPVVFSPEGQHMAYTAVTQDSDFVVVDGNESKKYDAIISPLVFGSATELHYLAGQGRNMVFVQHNLL